VDQIERLVPVPAAILELLARRNEIVWTAADAQAEREPPAGNLVDAGGLLRQQHWIARRPEQHIGQQPDPIRHCGSCGQGDQRIVVRIGDPVDRGERAETALLGAPCPLDQGAPLCAGNGVGEPDTDMHTILL